MKSRLSTCMTAIVLFAAFEAQAAAQKFTTLYSFDPNSTDGVCPSALIQATDGDLYGTTSCGGVNGNSGTVFKITPSGTLTTLHSFDSTDGSGLTGLIQATDGNFYGTTSSGGVYDAGTFFKITSSGRLTTLHSFDSTDGSGPSALIQATDGNFYGTTSGGGANNDGTVFKITAQGTLMVLHSFDSTNGSPPSALIQAADGNFYGTIPKGGVNGEGAVFKITPSGVLTTLYIFDGGADGFFPNGPLIQAAGGNLLGTTLLGGTNNDHCLIHGESVVGCGTVFTMTRSGSLTRLYSFCLEWLDGCTDGERPGAAPLQATDGNLYGTTWGGGPILPQLCVFGCGTIFKITPSGTLTTLHSFDSTDGLAPSALIQATDGNFYGTTSGGGANNSGTIFTLSVGLGPFVETEPTSGKVGATVYVLGTNLKSASEVNFNGTAATFAIVSATEIKTNVPKGATTGSLTVKTSGGTLKSKQIFRVLP